MVAGSGAKPVPNTKLAGPMLPGPAQLPVTPESTYPVAAIGTKRPDPVRVPLKSKVGLTQENWPVPVSA
jgi:hypothetical protein